MTSSKSATTGEKLAKVLVNDAEYCRGNLIHQTEERIASIIDSEISAAGGVAGQERRNAARYRWLRSDGLRHINFSELTPDTCDIGLDTAIDHALSAGVQPQADKKEEQ